MSVPLASTVMVTAMAAIVAVVIVVVGHMAVLLASMPGVGQQTKLTRRWDRRGTRPSAPVRETDETLALMTVIDATFLNCPWYGSRQMARHLRRAGHEVGRRRPGG